MLDILLIILLIIAFLSFGIASLKWPQTARRVDFGLMRLLVPVAFQVVVTRSIGIASIAFALVVAFGLLKGVFK